MGAFTGVQRMLYDPYSDGTPEGEAGRFERYRQDPHARQEQEGRVWYRALAVFVMAPGRLMVCLDKALELSPGAGLEDDLGNLYEVSGTGPDQPYEGAHCVELYPEPDCPGHYFTEHKKGS